MALRTQDILDEKKVVASRLSALRQQIAKLEKELGGLELRNEALGVLLGENSKVPSEDDEQVELPLARFSINPLGPTGLRPTIRATIAKVPGLKPREIVAKLAKAGFQGAAKTPLSTRVSNELFKLSKAGQVERRDDGGYYWTGGSAM